MQTFVEKSYKSFHKVKVTFVFLVSCEIAALYAFFPFYTDKFVFLFSRTAKFKIKVEYYWCFQIEVI